VVCSNLNLVSVQKLGHGLHWSGFESRSGQEIFLFKTSRPHMRPTKSPIQWVPGFFVRVNWLGPEVEDTLPSSAKVKRLNLE